MNSVSKPAVAPDNSVDSGEVERFSLLAKNWWDPDGPMRELHRLNPVRVAWIREQAAKRLAAGRDLAGLRVLDIGCGGGLLAEALARAGADVVAIDPAQASIAIARRHAEESGLQIDYRTTSVESLGGGERFDIVCAMEVIEHVVNPGRFVSTACDLVRPGGLFLAATLNRTLKSFALAIVGAEYVLGWVPRGTHRWENFITPDELESTMEDAGLGSIERVGVVYSPLTGEWRLSRDTGVNYMLTGVRDL